MQDCANDTKHKYIRAEGTARGQNTGRKRVGRAQCAEARKVDADNGWPKHTRPRGRQRRQRWQSGMERDGQQTETRAKKREQRISRPVGVGGAKEMNVAALPAPQRGASRPLLRSSSAALGSSGAGATRLLLRMRRTAREAQERETGEARPGEPKQRGRRSRGEEKNGRQTRSRDGKNQAQASRKAVEGNEKRCKGVRTLRVSSIVDARGR